MLRLIGLESENLYLNKTILESKQICPQITTLDIYPEYYLLSEDLSDNDLTKVLDILKAVKADAAKIKPHQKAFWVVPRMGTYSSWGSKALDILHLSGLSQVARIEKGLAYYFSFEAGFSPDEMVIAQLKKILHDRMVESFIDKASALNDIFSTPAQSQHEEVDIKNQGITALQICNKQLGLALSNVEIDFLYQSFTNLDRNPTDAELMMFSQINSEHCRHKVFNAKWTINGDEKPLGLFQMIKNTYRASPDGILSAYKDNASVIESFASCSFKRDTNGEYHFSTEKADILMKVETHNHPTAIEPFAGSGTGQGGEIRDEGATGRGSEPKVGLAGFTVSNLHIPGYKMPWESSYHVPNRIQDALQIMLKAPIGGAAFNNEFGRPNICGYFRTYEQALIDDREQYYAFGYHKPVMIAGGMGSIYSDNIKKLALKNGDLIIVLGGPAMKIGIGGGSASSMGQGQSDEQLDFASVQRQNPEMQRRAQEVISTCTMMSHNIIKSIHDVGAGGVANAISELVHESGLGVSLQLEKMPVADASMSPLEIMCNESQERYIIGIDPSELDAFHAIAKRERCPYQVVGTATDKPIIAAKRSDTEISPVHLPTSILFADPPQLEKNLERQPVAYAAVDTSVIELKESLERVLMAPTVADKSFLITIGDRTVTGLVAQDQMVGPWQVPVADCGVSASCYTTLTGEAMAMGERPMLSSINAKAMARMSVAEAVLNSLAADIHALSDIKLSCNWMADAKTPQQAIDLYDAVEAIGMGFCPQLGIAVPVGKDSMSMQTSWQQEDKRHQVISPVTLVVSAFSPVADIRKTITPLLNVSEATRLLMIDLSENHQRMGGSIFAQVTNQIGHECPDIEADTLKRFFHALRLLKDQEMVLAYHDKSDGGLWACVCEMAFASHVGLDIELSNYAVDEKSYIQALLNEEAGVVIQIKEQHYDAVMEIFANMHLASNVYNIASINQSDELNIKYQQKIIYSAKRSDLQSLWSKVSFKIQALRDNAALAEQSYARIKNNSDKGMHSIATPMFNLLPPTTTRKAKVAILREQGINGHREMAAAFTLAGFDAYDITMQDLLKGATLDAFNVLAVCGGFSYGDVLGAGKGWSNSIIHVQKLNDVFSKFFQRKDTLTLGVCNGCQMLSNLKDLIPGAEHWPSFTRNQSRQFEARLSMVEVIDSPSILLQGMTGLRMPIAVAHGEGQAVFSDDCQEKQCQDAKLATLRYIDNQGQYTNDYPFNPNGSSFGLTGLTTQDGRVTIMMPHPERVIKTWQLSWYPKAWDSVSEERFTPWIQMFYNAREWLKTLC